MSIRKGTKFLSREKESGPPGSNVKLEEGRTQKDSGSANVMHLCVFLRVCAFG